MQAFFEKAYGGSKTQANKYLKKVITESSSKADKDKLKAEKDAKRKTKKAEN